MLVKASELTAGVRIVIPLEGEFTVVMVIPLVRYGWTGSHDRVCVVATPQDPAYATVGIEYWDWCEVTVIEL